MLGLQELVSPARTFLTSFVINYASGGLAGPLCAPS